MAESIKEISRKIRTLEQELARIYEERRKQFGYRLKNRRVIFEREVRRRQKQFRIGLLKYVSHPDWGVVITAPIIYSLIIPLVLLDIFVTIYQYTCFPAYGIERVRRADYIAIDRHHLAYLNGLEKFNCIYCGYANGLLALVSEVASRTEAYWCPIKHARRLAAAHARYPEFADYGDAERYRMRLAQLRASVSRKAAAAAAAQPEAGRGDPPARG